VSGILLTNIVQFCYHKASKSRAHYPTHWQKWKPVYIVAVATIFSMLMPLAVLFVYVGEVGYPESKMWRGSWFPNTPLGISLYILKWVGMVMLLVGVVQITELHTKIRDKWDQIRTGETRTDVVKHQPEKEVPAAETPTAAGTPIPAAIKPAGCEKSS
jgi:hypothetical protein